MVRRSFLPVTFNSTLQRMRVIDEECAGGHVSNDYLLMMGKCSTVYGDLIISGWKGKRNLPKKKGI